MDTSLSHSLVRLGAAELYSVTAPRGRCLVVFHGKVWVTQEGDSCDHVVSSGESFTFDRAGIALVEALEPSSFVLLIEATQAPESIGYEAAWPRTEPKLLDSALLHARASEMRAQAQRRAVQRVARAARRMWSGFTSTAPLRQAA
jgi:hypothetical protein